MHAFRNRPLAQKLTIVITLTSGIVVIVAFALLLGVELVKARKMAVRGLDLLAKVTAQHSNRRGDI